MKKNLLALFLGMFLLVAHAFAQQKTISGKVTSAEDGLPMPGASVKVKGANAGVQTSMDGTYSLKANTGDVLVFSFIGTINQEKVVGAENTINVVLKADSKTLGEVVVTALGVKQDRKSLGYAVQEINSKDLALSNQPNAINALKGKAVGVQITSSGGAAGAGTRIQIRGVNSLNPSANNQPLFVIDGIPVSNNTDQYGGAGGDSYQNTNRFSDINTDDIESMSILKGPAASVLYGLRAANGAVIITTKAGKAGNTKVDYKVSYSFDDVAKKPPIQTTFGNGNNGAYVPSVNSWGPKIAEGQKVYNPYDEFFKTGHMLQNNLNFSGGTDKATYFTSIANVSQNGVVPNSKYNKTSVRLSGTLKASDKLKFDGSANYIKSGGTNPRTGVGSGSIFYLMKHTNTVDPADYLNPDGTQKVYNAAIDNPFYFANNAYLKDNVNRIIGNVGAEYAPLDWLTLNYKAGIDQYSDFRQAYVRDGLLISPLGTMVEQRLSYAEINSNFYVKAAKQISKDLFGTLLVGNTITNVQQTDLATTGSQVIIPGVRSINNYNVYTTKGYSPEKNNIGLFADLKLNYKEMLFLSVTGRNDWSSTLPAANRSFFYPSVSLSYVFTENFGLKDNDILSFGKLRASYAEVGKDADPYQIGQYYSTLQAFGGVSGTARITTLGSETLKPERTKGFEFGTELRFFKDRITLDANYAILNSVDQIVPVPVSYASGYDVFITNAGKIRNNSLEFLLNANIINSRDFKWDINANWSRTVGKVLSMPPGVNEISFNPEAPWVKQIIKTGGRPGDWYGWPYTRVTDGGAYNGQLLIGNDGFPIVPQPLSQNYLVGNAFPNWVAGLGSTMSYKGLTFSFLFNFRKGGDVFDITRWQRYATGIGAETQMRNTQVIFNGVRNIGTAGSPNYVQNNIPVTLDQNFYTNAFQYRLATENNGFQDASWIRLQNVSLSYALPKAWLGKTKVIKGASVSFSANNLWVTTPFVGFDPEGSTYGSGSNAVGYVGTGIPTTRSFFVGLNVNF